MKERLYKEACPQKQVLDASAVLIACGNLEQYKNLPEIVQNTPSMDDATRNRLVQDAAKNYASDAAFARDEAIRSASFFSMTFMFAATAAGFGTGPMIGFDSKKVCELLDIRAPYFPVLMISMGFVKDQPFPRGWRRPVAAFARFI
jgi:nitroreductase